MPVSLRRYPAMRLLSIFGFLAILALPLPSATLEKLSLDDMINQSTAIVRGRVASAGAFYRGPMIYSRWRVQVTERWKGPELAVVEVVIPGGAANGYRQTVSGAPTPLEGSEYVLFLWTGQSGLTHVIGLSQGLFDLKSNSKGEPTASRAAASEAMLDPATGAEIKDEPLSMKLDELRQRVRKTLASARK